VSVQLLEQAADALGELLEEVVFVGAATVTLWITDPGAPPVRATRDVDVIVEVTTRAGFHEFEERLRDIRFVEDRESGIICRWRHRDSGLILDAMPADASLLGFANRWQASAVPHAVRRELPSGAFIRAVPPPYLLATKLEAFRGRGQGDFLGSRDFGDVIALIDGREELPDEVADCDQDLRTYLATELRRVMETPRFMDGVFGALQPDSASQARAETVVVPRIRALLDPG
jgi:nucleotidyltransferase AbiEii toxin of type IV toxin-antitoxin system